jgi:outer membrane protein OmpA-like peptidoglycan-associated protein
LIAAVFAAATPAAADCPALAAAFDRAVAAKSIDGEVSAMSGIAKDIGCNRRTDEFRRKLIDSMIDLAGDPQVSAADQKKALERAEGTIAIGGTWRHAEHLADFYARRNDNAAALSWYETALSRVASIPSEPASADDIRQLRTRASAAKILASDDDGGKKPAKLAESHREMDGRIGGIYSRDLLRGAEVEAVPLPINFVTGETKFTAVGEQAVGELAKALGEQTVKAMTLVGHADPRGDRQFNLSLSKRRAEAVRDYLAQHGVSAQIGVQGVGSDQPFDAALLGRPVSQDEAWALDRRVEWVRDPATE